MTTISAIAHRGHSAAAPENTLAAFRKAIELGPEMIECDVRRTRDGNLVVIHDPTVDRTTDGKGRVADLTLADIKKLDAGGWFGPEFAGERIPTLDEALELSSGKVKLIIEIKENGLEDQVTALVADRGMLGEVLIASFHYQIGVRLFELAPEIPFVVLLGLDHELVGSEAVSVVDEAAAVNGSIFGLNYAAVSPDVVAACHSANLSLMAWTVDKEEDMRRMIEMGVRTIASNRLDLLLRVLSEAQAR